MSAKYDSVVDASPPLLSCVSIMWRSNFSMSFGVIFLSIIVVCLDRPPAVSALRFYNPQRVRARFTSFLRSHLPALRETKELALPSSSPTAAGFSADFPGNLESWNGDRNLAWMTTGKRTEFPSLSLASPANGVADVVDSLGPLGEDK